MIGRQRVVAIVQARMGSTRLPGKVLLDLAGEPVLTRVLSRLRRARLLDEVVVATTLEPDAAKIVDLCRAERCAVWRGSMDDVLDRFYGAAQHFGADVVVRVTSDCPLIEPAVVDLVVREFLAGEALDYCSNTIPPRSFPRGLDTEAVAFAALERAFREDANPAWREHVTPFLYRHPEMFRLRTVVDEVDRSAMRWTVDTPEDLEFCRMVYSHFGHDRFTWREVLKALDEHPEWQAINAHIEQKPVL